MAVGSAVPVGADDTVPGPMATDRRRTVVRSTVVVVVVGAVLAVLAWWPEPGPPALVPDAVGATPRAPRGPVAWRWSLPQEGPVQYLDVVGDTLVVMDLHTTVGAEGLPRRPVQRLRLVDTVTGGVQWQHRLLGNEAIVLVEDDDAVTSIVPTALGSPAFVVALGRVDGVARWRTPVRDIDGIATDGGRVVVHGGEGCIELAPADGTEQRRLDGGPCLPWGTALAEAGTDGWQLWRDDATLGPRVAGAQPPAPLDDGLVVARGDEVVATRADGATAWRLRLGESPQVVRPFSGVGVRIDGSETSTIVAPDGRVLARVPWWYRGIVDGEGMTFLDVPSRLDRGRADQVRIVAADGEVLATAGVMPETIAEDRLSASAVSADRVGPSMFCPAATVTCRARRWPAIRLTADGVLMEDGGTLGLHDLQDLEALWQVGLEGAAVDALAAGQRGVVALVTDAEGRGELRGFA